MKIKKILIGIISLGLIIGLSILGILTYTSYNLGKQTIIDEYNNGVKLTNGATKAIGGWDSYKDSEKLEVVLTEFSLDKPVYTFIHKTKSNDSIKMEIIRLQRTSLFSFEVLGYNLAFGRGYSFEEMLAIVKKTNLVKNNPDPKKIEVRPALTEEEIKKNKAELEAKEKNTKEFSEFIKEGEELQKMNKEDKIKWVDKYLEIYTNLRAEKEIKKEKKENFTFMIFGVKCTPEIQKGNIEGVDPNPCDIELIIRQIQSLKKELTK